MKKFEESADESKMINRYLAGKALKIAFLIALIIVLLILTSCASNKIAGAERGKTEDYWKIPNSTYFRVVIRTDSCTTYTTKWNSDCWRCKDADVPKLWDVVYLKNGSSYSQPVK